MSNAKKNFYILVTNLSILHNCFDDPTKLFLDLYLVKFLDFNKTVLSEYEKYNSNLKIYVSYIRMLYLLVIYEFYLIKY